MAARGERTLIVTVGSTRFDALVARVQDDDVLQAIGGLAPKAHVLVQYGKSDVRPPAHATPTIVHGVEALVYAKDNVHVYLFRYAPSLQAFMDASDMVLAHGGAYFL